MKRQLLYCLGLTLLSVVTATASVKEPDSLNMNSEVKELSGMSIVGNDEAPKSLYIVPWKSSEIGVETSLSMMLDMDNGPVDRDVFKRRLDFYEVSTANNSGRIN